MSSIRDLKKDINYVVGDIIEAVYISEELSNKQDTKEGSEIIDEAITVFDELISQVNKKDVDNKKKHYQGIRKELEEKANKLIVKVNKLD